MPYIIQINICITDLDSKNPFDRFVIDAINFKLNTFTLEKTSFILTISNTYNKILNEFVIKFEDRCFIKSFIAF